MYNVTDKYKELIAEPIRYTGLSGAVLLKSGEVIQITDSNVAEGSLKIISKLNGKGDFRTGGVYSSEMSIGLLGFDGLTGALDGAALQLTFCIYHNAEMNEGEVEKVPLGVFFADGASIKRRNKRVTLKAVDSLMLLDIPAAKRNGTLWQLAAEACHRAGIQMGMTQAEFEAMPNATLSVTVDTAIIQTERDLLMYISMITASFVRINRSNMLEFVSISATINEGNVIVPVREINGDTRFVTEFSDDVVRIMKVFTNLNKTTLWSDLNITGNTHKPAALELMFNPLLESMSEEAVVEVLNNVLKQLAYCLNRAFDCDFSGDPALQAGDYVRLKGGSIDTARGYGTGMITSQVWRYRGKHTIKCTLPSSLADISVSAQSAQTVSETAEGSAAETVTDELMHIQPKSQIEKRLDALESSGTDGDTTIENAIILTQKDLGYLIHSYKVVEYFKDFQTLALGVDTSIVVNGYLAAREYSDAPIYGSISWDEIKSTSSGEIVPTTISADIVSSSVDSNKIPYVSVKLNDNGTSRGTVSSYGSFGLKITFDTVYAPTSTCPYGYADCDVRLYYTNSDDELKQYTSGSAGGNIAFSSIEEYEAAIRLYQESNSGYEIIQNTTQG